MMASYSFIEYLRLIFLFLLTFFNYRVTAKTTCFQASGENAIGATCEGDYCLYAELAGIDRPIRGCLNGDLLKSNIPDQCEQNRLDNRKVCVCSRPVCNVNSNRIKVEKPKLVKCYDCENKNCTKDTMCLGEYCVLIKYPKKIVRGCSNPSMPLFERKGLGSCVTSSFPSHIVQKHWDESTLKAMTCMCNDRDYCNGVVLSNHIRKDDKSLKKCPVRAYASTKLGTYTSPTVPDCQGEHCFNVAVEMDGVTSNVSGCMSFYELGGKKERPQLEELEERGCMTIHSEALRVKVCFDTDNSKDKSSDDDQDDDDDDEKKEQPQEPEDDKEDDDTRYTKENQQKDEKVKMTKNKTPKERESPLSDEEDKKKPDSTPETSIKPKVAHFIHGDVDPDNPVLKPESEGNTAIVAVFVAIMVLIVIAGVIWKFELHKKLFQARYQTVAG